MAKRKEKYTFISGLRQFKLPLSKVHCGCTFGMPVEEGKLRIFLLHHLNPNPWGQDHTFSYLCHWISFYNYYTATFPQVNNSDHWPTKYKFFLILLLLLLFFTLQYCIGFAIHQHASAMNRQYMFDAGYRKLGAGALGWPRGMVWGGRWEGGSEWGTCVHPRRMHVDVWQNQYNIVK